MNNHPLLLIIDDETTILQTLKEALEDEQYRVEILSNGYKTLDLIGKLIPDLVLLDIFMPNCNGLELLKKIKNEYPQQKVIMISGFGNIPIAIEAVKKGALDFIEKPLNLDEILSKINFLKKENSQNTSPKTIFQKNDTLIGQSYLFLELIQQIEHVSKLKLPLIIYGQHGTGKTLIAKYIHKKISHKKDIFFTLNCSSLEEEKILQKIENVFQQENGTLLIKNINYLNLSAQKKLLFYLEKYNNTKIKLIATSKIPLFNLVKQEKFNSSLFHKLNITPLEIPPLNKRRYDIPLLVDFYLKKLNKQYQKSIVLDNKSIRMLRNHDWHGNITELKTVIQKIICTLPEKFQVVTPQILTDYLGEKKAQILEEQSYLKFNSLKEATFTFERNFLIYLLKKNRYDIKQLSDQLSLTPFQLRDKMLKLNIEIKI
jgi:two-component system, NtrC family, nitrogen regulation response regulator NtrX